MSNYIRAGFCIDHPVHPDQFYNLLLSLEQIGVRYNVWKVDKVWGHLLQSGQDVSLKETAVDPSPDTRKMEQVAEWLTVPGYLNIDLGWRVGEQVRAARLQHMWWTESGPRRLSFDVEEDIFLPGASIEYMPAQDPAFEQYKWALIQLIRHVDPLLGVIDYEADWLCGPPEDRQYRFFVSWGNYYSDRFIHERLKGHLPELLRIVDEHVRVDELGVLTFIHPLMANQNWTPRHEQVRALLARNWTR